MDDYYSERLPCRAAKLNSNTINPPLLNSSIAPVIVGLAVGIAFIVAMIFVMEDRIASGKAFYGSSEKTIGSNDPDLDDSHSSFFSTPPKIIIESIEHDDEDLP